MDTTKRSEGLSIFTAIAFAVGTMVGAGVFVLSGIVIGSVGELAILSYVICGIVVIFSALSYAALASIFPEDGGGYLFARMILGGYPGFLSGWAMIVSNLISVAFVLLGFGIYSSILFGINIDPRIGALISVIVLTALNMKGISEAGKFEVILVVTKILILVIFIIAGLTLLHRENWTLPHMSVSGTGGLIQGITMVFFAYMGFQVVSMMGGEIKESSKTVPIATIVSLGIVGVIYVGVILALISANLPNYGQKSVFDAAVKLLGIYGGYLVAFAATISTLSSANASIIGTSRITLEMASERQIPGSFAKLVNGQPFNSILLGAIITAVLIIYGDLGFIVNLTNTTVLISMFIVNISAFMLINRKRVPSEKSYFKLPFGTLFPILGAVSSVLMLLSLPAPTIIMGIIALFVGTIFYMMEDTHAGQLEILKIRRILGRPLTYKYLTGKMKFDNIIDQFKK